MNDNIKSFIVLCLALYFITVGMKPFITYCEGLKSHDKGPSTVTLINGCDSLIITTDLLSYLPIHVPFEIKDFRPFVQDIVKSYYKYPDDLEKSSYKFCGRGFCLWIANGFSYFALSEPKDVEFTEDEKKYLWELYKSWSPNVEIKY